MFLANTIGSKTLQTNKGEKDLQDNQETYQKLHKTDAKHIFYSCQLFQSTSIAGEREGRAVLS